VDVKASNRNKAAQLALQLNEVELDDEVELDNEVELNALQLDDHRQVLTYKIPPRALL